MIRGIPWTYFLAAGCCSFALSLMLTALAIRVAPRIGFVDKPGGHKSHANSKPYGGGTTMFLAAWAPFIALMAGAFLVPSEWVGVQFGEAVQAYVGGARARWVEATVILAGGVVLHAMGLVDDVKPLGPAVKLPVILAVAVATACWGQVRLFEMWGPAISLVLTTLWFGVIINAMNFLDNMDGLSGGIALICAACLMFCGWMSGQILVPALAAVFVGAILGFLVFNFPPAKIFMGDAGSLLLGYVLAVLSVRTTYFTGNGVTPPYALATPLVVLAVPLYDFCTVISIRIAEGRNPLKGDQRHFSHRLVEHGLSRRFAVVTIYLATAATGLAGTLLPGAGLRETVTIAAIVVLVLTIIAILERPVARET